MKEKINTERNDASSTAEKLTSELTDIKHDQADFVTVLRKPIDQLPPIDNESREGDEFWAQRRLHPGGEEDNYHNMPILQFGIDYEGNEAVLTVPSLDYINSVVGEYNPGGFTFVEVGAGIGDADTFLSRIANKQFPVSDSKTIGYYGVPDWYLDFNNFFEDTNAKQTHTDHGVTIKASQADIYDPNYSMTERISLFEHDRVDHWGISALPASETDTLAKAAEFARQGVASFGPDIMLHSQITAYLDRYLDTLSAYALIHYNPNDIEIQNYKDYLWETISSAADILDEHLRSQLVWSEEYRDHIRTTGSDTQQDVDALFASKDVTFHIDRELFDANIARMQAIAAQV